MPSSRVRLRALLPTVTLPLTLALATLAAPVSAAPAVAERCASTSATGFPARRTRAPSGSAFAARIARLDEQQREAAILEQVLKGNVPGFLRHFRPVRLELSKPGKPRQVAIVCVMPDYLAIGSDDDFVRVPVNRYTADRIARELDFILPTRKLVDAIYRQSSIHLPPVPMPPGPRMRSTEYYVAHNKTIARQERAAGIHPGVLVAGHKKDLVLSNKLARHPNRVAIYGWHHADGKPIQPLSTVHGARYADYSHGLRLVSRVILLNGKQTRAEQVLQDPGLGELLSDEGPLQPGVLADL
ncbi:MAG: hypothetical protein KDK91_16540 [Gammaproteobacteria bacterium]|nr:hypothetical protein [Gammaproteobacteria bacterium]